MTALLSIQEVFFRYEHTGPWIVSNASCTVHRGDFIGIIGPNGGGKTSLALLMLGLLKPSSGEIRTIPPESSSHLTIGWVPQHFAYDHLFPISVEEVVLSGRLGTLPWHGRYSDYDRQCANEALDIVGLLTHKEACFSRLSGGQMQRVLLARALASHPELLILDEPTANIDPENQQRILRILSDLNKDCTILMITHDLHHTANCFNKVFLMNRTLTTVSDTQHISKQFCCPTKCRES